MSNKKSAVSFFIALSPFLILIFYKIACFFELPALCLWKNLTGHNCLGCGMTKALFLLLTGDLSGAYYQNSLVFIVFPLLLFVWLRYLQSFSRTK